MIRRTNYFPTYLLDNLFDDVFSTQKVSAPAENSSFKLMRTDVKETDGGFDLSIELPGYDKEDVSAELKDGYMTIKASKNTENEEKAEDGRIIRKERYSGSLSRSFYVGEDIEEEDIKAKLTNGVLSIFIPKKEAKPQVEEKRSILIEG